MHRVKYLIFGLFVGALFLCPNFIFAQTSSKEAKLILVKGDVKIQRAGRVEWLDAKVGMRVGDGDTAKTGKASALEIAFDKENKNVVRLEENTTAILRGRWLREIELPQGRIRSLIKKLRSDSYFEIRTPTAVAGARGSGWEVISNPSDRINEIKAFEDEIYVKLFEEQEQRIKEAIILGEGYKVIFYYFETLGALMELAQWEKEDWNTWESDFMERMMIEDMKKQGQEISESAKSAEINLENIRLKDEYKEQVFEAQEIDRVEDRAASGETSGGRGETGGGSGGRGGSQGY